MLHRIRIRPIALLAVALLAGAGAVWLPSASAAPASVTGGSLDWGVKESFRSYVSTNPIAAPGSIAVHDSATKNSDGTYHFPSAPGGTFDAASGDVNAAHVGGVKFTAHLGSLEIDIYNLRVKTDASSPTGAFLFADAKSRPFKGFGAAPANPVQYTNVPIVTVDLSKATRSTPAATTTRFAGAPTTLTQQGVPVFGGFYEKGTAFDALTFQMSTTAVSTTTSTSAPSPTTSTTLDATTTTTVTNGSTTTTSTTAAEEPTTTTTAAPEPSTTTTTVAPTSSIDAPTTGVGISSGYLDWGVKTSFRNYVKGPIAQGSITVTPPATSNADESIRFPLNGTTGKYDAAAKRAAAPFGGSVHYVGHEGQLDLKITDPRVTLKGTVGTLVADVVSRTLGSDASQTYDDVVLASLDLSGVTPVAVTNGVRWTGVPATLTAQGAPAFAGFYNAGTALDPLNLTIGTTGQVDSTPTTVAGPKIELVLGTPKPGSVITVSGSGFVAGEQVQIAVLSTPIALKTVVAAADGSVAATTVTLPATLEPGSHQIRLLGLFSNKQVLSSAFIVTANAATLPRTGEDVEVYALIGALALAVGFVLSRTDRHRGLTSRQK